MALAFDPDYIAVSRMMIEWHYDLLKQLFGEPEDRDEQTITVPIPIVANVYPRRSSHEPILWSLFDCFEGGSVDMQRRIMDLSFPNWKLRASVDDDIGVLG